MSGQPGRWVNGDTIGYVRTGKGNAIDFGPVAVPTPMGTAHTTPLEANWVTQGRRSEALVTENRFSRGRTAAAAEDRYYRPRPARSPTRAPLLSIDQEVVVYVRMRAGRSRRRPCRTVRSGR